MENNPSCSSRSISHKHHSLLWKSIAIQAFQEVLEIHCDQICPCQPSSLEMNLSRVLCSQQGTGVKPSGTEAALAALHPWSSVSTPAGVLTVRGLWTSLLVGTSGGLRGLFPFFLLFFSFLEDPLLSSLGSVCVTKTSPDCPSLSLLSLSLLSLTGLWGLWGCSFLLFSESSLLSYQFLVYTLYLVLVFFLLNYSWFTMLCLCHRYSRMIHVCICRYVFFRLFPPLGYCKTLNIASRAIQLRPWCLSVLCTVVCICSSQTPVYPPFATPSFPLW